MSVGPLQYEYQEQQEVILDGYHSEMVSTQDFRCLPLRLFSSTVHCMVVLARELCRLTCPYQVSFLRFTVSRSSSCGPVSSSTRLRTNSFVLCSVCGIRNNFRNAFISNACILLHVSAFKVQLSQPYRNIETSSVLKIVTLTLKLKVLLFQIVSKRVNAEVA